MKNLNSFFAVVLTAGSIASADTCYQLSRNIETGVQSGTSAVSSLSNDLRGAARIESTLTNIAGRLEGTTLDLDRELGGSVSDPESSVRSAQASNQGALSELRRAASGDESLGSEAFRIAGRAASTLDGAKQSMVSAANRVAEIKTRVSQLHHQLADNSNAQDVKQEISASLYAVGSLENKLGTFDRLRYLDNDVSNYVRSCSMPDYSCSRIRNDLSVAADRSRNIGDNLVDSSSDVRHFERLVSDAAGNLRGLPVIDINSQLNSYIDSQVLPPLQDAVNNLHNAATAAREASTAPSGVRFDQLMKGTAIPSSENAERSAQSGLAGLSGLRSRISDLARQISSGGGNQAVAQILRQAARDIAGLVRQTENSVQKLGGQWGRGGYLQDVQTALNDHQRSGCEVRE